ncbi:gfo/Idh/MocA family oxidoreductase [candidate division KSB1 bacterium]|nr:Gfo/Idh/MocA family oxidoreductase [candidate division KSB1 bacterium]RQW00132.1 MAG: gfo/Idh/MocA family oxidoreductase [candidate division KSB1 bacterium]
MSKLFNRRDFFKGFGLLAAAPMILPSRVWSGNDLPGNRINIAVIGIGKQGTGLLRGFLHAPGTQVVAVCDVDRQKLAYGQQATDDFYAEKTGSPYKACQATIDFRDIIARDDIDAIVLATPDHWHALPSILAAQAGMDIYCEKPLSLTIGEARLMVEHVRRNGRVFQTGSMQRSSDRFRQACELLRNGYIGEIKHVRVSIRTGFMPHPIDCDLPAESTPPELEWDFWQGQAPARPYNSKLAPSINFDGWPAWRDYRAYSGGGMTDWGAHHFDIAQWALGMDESGPIEIFPASHSDYKLLTYRYKNGVEMTTDFDDNFIRFEGTKGTVTVNRQSLTTEPAHLSSKKIAPNEIFLYKSNDHRMDFLNAIRHRSKPIADVEIGARSVTVCHLGNLAYQLDRPLHWDPEKEEFINDEEANRMRFRAQRSPWII